FAMSSDDASSTVTYTSLSSGSSEPSAWGIPLVNAGEIPNVDPYEKVAQHGQAHPLSPAYVPDPMELDEHVPLYVPDHPEHHDSSEENMPVEDQSDAEDANSHGFLTDSDSMEDDTDAGLIDYPDEPEDGEDDDEDPEEDPIEEHESEEGEAKEDEPFEDSDRTEEFEVDETTATRPPTNPTYDQAPLGHRAAMIRIRDDIPEEVMEDSLNMIRRHYGHRDSNDPYESDIRGWTCHLRGMNLSYAPPPGCDVAESSAAAAARAPRGVY
ncbi:hypothetical protein Tco_1350697, partial [Tanacetum coccineum]